MHLNINVCQRLQDGVFDIKRMLFRYLQQMHGHNGG